MHKGGTLILNWQWRAKEHITLPLKSIDLEKLKKIFLRWLWGKKKLALPTKARFKFLGRKGKKSGGKIKVIGTSLVVQWLRFHASNVGAEFNPWSGN